MTTTPSIDARITADARQLLMIRGAYPKLAISERALIAARGIYTAAASGRLDAGIEAAIESGMYGNRVGLSVALENALDQADADIDTAEHREIV